MRTTESQLLGMMPQQPPFRFVDRIVSLDDKHVVTEYTFRTDEYFYSGHFPGDPVTPGVILIETMGQGALVLPGLYLLIRDHGLEEISRYRTLLTAVHAEFSWVVRPGDGVVVHGEIVMWRRHVLRSNVKMTRPAGELIAKATLTGMAVVA
jgi:3-hydroxyacyl-[acyl-carrier-protein] dehydratase